MIMASNPFWSCLIDTGFDLEEALTLPGNLSQQITDSKNSTIVADMPTVLTPVDAVCAVCMEEGFRSGAEFGVNLGERGETGINASMNEGRALTDVDIEGRTNNSGHTNVNTEECEAEVTQQSGNTSLHKNAKVSGIIHEKARDCRVSTKLF
uniref:Uncharacterized protein n=1 Tax=Salix viminalis TaxID=40686 RepID=A0A6N2MR85_SALVM